MGMFKSDPKIIETGGHEFRKDLLSIEIFKMEEEKRQEKVASAEGSYLEQIKYEGEEESIWSINDDISRVVWVAVDAKLILPSDSGKR